MRGKAVLACAVVLTAAACSTATARRDASTSSSAAVSVQRQAARSTPVDPYAAQAAANRAAATAEAQHLLKSAILPAGAVVIGDDPDVPDEPASGGSTGSGFIDRHTDWQVPGGFDAVAHFMHTHVPAGLITSSITPSSGSGPGTRSIGFGLGAPSSPAWVQAGFAVSVTATHDGRTVVRVDGMTSWIDPAPLPDSDGQTPFSLVADRCPVTDIGRTAARNHGPAFAQRLLPSTAPVSGTVCAYNGINPKTIGRGTAQQRVIESHGLLASRTLTGPTARALSAKAAAVSLGHVDGQIYNCPMDDGATTFAVFNYPTGTAVLAETTTGCRSVSNGQVLVTADTSDYQHLNALYTALDKTTQ